jgi:hypothetical protein
MTRREIKKTVLELMDCLCSRAGFDDWYYSLNDDTQEEIDRELYSLIKRRIEESQRKKKN